MKHLIVGTAGHIDHGKSALVKALTGIDPDRLKEEKERGLTIDLGFAHFDLADGTRVAFVDVPGHERFVKNMLAGAAGMDIVLLVVDATESVMPQTREHLDIMRLLGISRGIVAITKIDIADDEMIEIVEDELGDILEGTFLETAPMVRVSSRTGEGIEKIKQLIAQAVSEQRQKNEEGVFRFPIDRVFTMKGFGTVVTGTVFSGWLGEDEPVLVLPGRISTRARQLQSHNVKQEKITAGMRASLNLTNVSVQQLKRGDTLVRDGTAADSDLLDANIRLLASAPRKLSRTSGIKLYVATGQRMTRMTLMDKPKLEPGETAYAQLRLAQPLCVFRGDRFVIRGESPEFTIGGGTVLDVGPSKFKRKDYGRPDWLRMLETATLEEAALAFLSQSRVGARLRELAVRLGEPAAAVRAIIDKNHENGTVLCLSLGDDIMIIRRDNFDELKRTAADELSGFFSSQSHRLFMPREELRSRLGADLEPGMFEKILDELTRSGNMELTREGINFKGRKPEISPAQKAAKAKMEALFREAGFSPPTLAQAEEQSEDPEIARQMISLMLEEGTLRRISPTLAYHHETLELAIRKIRDHFKQADKLSVGDLKNSLSITRKHTVPLLEYFDRIGLTSRAGDHRILREKLRT